jgi:hypothetical protein
MHIMPRWRNAGKVVWRSIQLWPDSAIRIWRLQKVIESKKSLQVQKTFEALFALEDLRELLRQSLPTGFNDKQQEEFSNTITRIKGIIADLEKGEGKSVSNRVGMLDPRTREEDFINIHPI